MIFGRVKPLDAILATAEKKSLHRSLGAFQLTMLGIGAIIGTGIFVLTAEAAQKAGPGHDARLRHRRLRLRGGRAVLCRDRLDGAGLGLAPTPTPTPCWANCFAWMVGWALILEYAVAAGAVSVGWSGYFIGLLPQTQFLGDALARHRSAPGRLGAGRSARAGSQPARVRASRCW